MPFTANTIFRSNSLLQLCNNLVTHNIDQTDPPWSFNLHSTMIFHAIFFFKVSLSNVPIAGYALPCLNPIYPGTFIYANFICISQWWVVPINIEFSLMVKQEWRKQFPMQSVFEPQWFGAHITRQMKLKLANHNNLVQQILIYYLW